MGKLFNCCHVGWTIFLYNMFDFRQLCERLTPFYQSSSRCYKTPILQSLLNCLEQNPDMELAVVAQTTGLTDCLKHEKIAASAKAVDSTDAGKTDTSLLQAAKVPLEFKS